MQQVEKALEKVIIEGIGSNYKLPEGEKVFGTDYDNPFYGEEAKTVKFGYGTKKELDVWIAQHSDKYPLIWLVYPVKETFTNNAQSLVSYPRAKLVFAINTSNERRVETRLLTTRYVLDQLQDKFFELMRISKYKKFIYVDKKTNIESTFEPNYAVTLDQDKNTTIDVWDAIVCQCDLYFIPNCLK